MSGSTSQGWVLIQQARERIRVPRAVRCLRHLLQHIVGQLFIIWVGVPIQHCQAVKRFVAQGGAARLWLAALPGYAPDLNPDEGIWRLLKRVALRKSCCRTLDELEHELRLAVAQLCHKRTVLGGCRRQPGCY